MESRGICTAAARHTDTQTHRHTDIHTCKRGDRIEGEKRKKGNKVAANGVCVYGTPHYTPKRRRPLPRTGKNGRQKKRKKTVAKKAHSLGRISHGPIEGEGVSFRVFFFSLAYFLFPVRFLSTKTISRKKSDGIDTHHFLLFPFSLAKLSSPCT